MQIEVIPTTTTSVCGSAGGVYVCVCVCVCVIFKVFKQRMQVRSVQIIMGSDIHIARIPQTLWNPMCYDCLLCYSISKINGRSRNGSSGSCPGG